MSSSLFRLRQYERPQRVNVTLIFEVLLSVVAILLLLAALGAGLQAYRSVTNDRALDQQTRESLFLITNSIRGADAKDAIGRGEGPQGDSLVLIEHLDSGDFETRIYEYNGSIVEEYATSGSAYTPAKAVQISESSRFDFAYKDGLLTISTDQGDASIALKCAEEGA